MNALYFDCFSGAAGDMILGALLDAGADPERVREGIAGLGIEEVGFDHAPGQRGGLRCTLVDFDIPDKASERSYRDIVTLIEAAKLSSSVTQRSLQTFAILAAAEARVHGVAVDEVHFHEVGALDTIADVVGCAIALEHFAPATIVCSALPIGSGTVETAHGTLPIPAPAVAEILAGVPIRPGGETEVVTPTGAAILVAAAHRFGDPPPMQLRTTGYGGGSKELAIPNVLRVLVGDSIDAAISDHFLIETNIDDMNPEFVPYVIESLLRAGAQDAWVTPITMKKGRPAVTLSALTASEQRDLVMDVFYRETTTLGLRIRPVEKDELVREWVEVDVEGQPVKVKIGRRGTDVVTVAPEYEDAARVARGAGLSLREVYERAAAAARTSLRI